MLSWRARPLSIGSQLVLSGVSDSGGIFDCDAAGTFATDSDFSVCLGPADAAALEAALLSDPDALLDAFASIDVTKAQAGHPEDQSRIMGAV